MYINYMVNKVGLLLQLTLSRHLWNVYHNRDPLLFTSLARLKEMDWPVLISNVTGYIEADNVL